LAPFSKSKENFIASLRSFSKVEEEEEEKKEKEEKKRIKRRRNKISQLLLSSQLPSKKRERSSLNPQVFHLKGGEAKIRI